MPKAEVRALAARMGLAVAGKQDSQDICFIPRGRYGDLIAKLRPGSATPGDIVHLDGRVLGRHEGVLHYTVGQRRGIGIATGEPLYVVHIDAAAARVIVGPREALETRRVALRDMNWLGDTALDAIPAEGIEIHARVRSTRPPAPARLVLADGQPMVELALGEQGVAPGQACVLYDGGADDARVLGGGFIARSERGPEAERMLKRIAATAPGVDA
jgi:tRNA-specific 2-thiouridylase